jgi:hypothetical protein
MKKPQQVHHQQQYLTTLIFQPFSEDFMGHRMAFSAQSSSFLQQCYFQLDEPLKKVFYNVHGVPFDL